MNRSPAARPFRLLPALLALALLVPAAGPAFAKDDSKLSRKEKKEAVAELPEKYRDWLEAVSPIISDEEVAAFLALEKDYQRDAFIQSFWKARDPYKSTARNEFQDRFEANIEQAKTLFGTLGDERAKIFLLNGPPAARLVSQCSTVLWPVEVWFYAGSDRMRSEFFVVFYRRWGAGNFRVWLPLEGLDSLFVNSSASASGAQGANLSAVANGCIDGDKLAGAIAWVARQGMGYDLLLQKVQELPQDVSGEWVAGFSSYSTDVPDDAARLDGKLQVEFPGRRQNRTVVQGVVSIPARQAGLAELAEHRSYNLLLTGEVLQDGKLFDNFRYRFDLPASSITGAAAGPGPGEIEREATVASLGTAPAAAAEGGAGEPSGPEAQLPLVFQRWLRPGEYMLVVKVEDVNGGKFFRAERSLSVPFVDKDLPPPAPADPETARLLAEANAAIARGETTLKLVPPHGELHTGMLRFDTLATGDIDQVTFALDGKPVLTKKRAPYSVELDLGATPRTRRLTATAFDPGGEELARDELLLNAAGHRFRVQLVEPRKGQRYESSLLARAEVEVPEGQAVDRVELFLNETRVATLYQEPWEQPIVLPNQEQLAYVRAVAYLPDGNSTEDTEFVNAPEYLEEIDVELVELYTTVVDRRGRPVSGLAETDFSISEDGAPQEILRFERVTDLPIHAAVALDVSASMEGSLERARDAALQFLENTVQPKDRAAIVTFNDHPNLAVKFTNDVTRLAGGLAGLKAERGTALWDSVVFTLYYFNGLKGQRAVLLLSDGKDEGSRFTFEDALEYAHRAGVTVYAIGLGDQVDKKRLTRLAEETGGASFFLKSADELPGIYAAVEEELRSKYLLTYQSTNTGGGNGFRSVDLQVHRDGLEAKTLRGYYP